MDESQRIIQPAPFDPRKGRCEADRRARCLARMVCRIVPVKMAGDMLVGDAVIVGVATIFDLGCGSAVAFDRLAYPLQEDSIKA